MVPEVKKEPFWALLPETQNSYNSINRKSGMIRKEKL